MGPLHISGQLRYPQLINLYRDSHIEIILWSLAYKQLMFDHTAEFYDVLVLVLTPRHEVRLALYPLAHIHSFIVALV